MSSRNISFGELMETLAYDLADAIWELIQNKQKNAHQNGEILDRGDVLLALRVVELEFSMEASKVHLLDYGKNKRSKK